MRGGYVLAGLPQHAIALGTRGKGCRHLAQLGCFFSKALFEGFGLFETTSFCTALLLSMRGRRERKPALSSPIKATIRAVMVPDVRRAEGLLLIENQFGFPI